MALRPKMELHQYRGHVRTVAPAVEPVSAAQLRSFLSETVDGLPDGEADALIKEARELIEEMTGIALNTQTWRMAIDRWPGGRELWWDGVRQGAISELHGPRSYSDLRLPRYPLQSVDAVTVYDEASNSTSVVVANVFDVDVYQKPGRMALKTGATWPIALREINAIEIDYIAGYGDLAADVPAGLVRAVKQVAAYLHTHKGDDCQIDDALGAARSLLAAYEVREI